MGLKIWLPLLGNLNNQGYENIDITNSGVTTDANGKLGQCYYFNGSTHLQMASPDGIKSVCFWIKTTVTASRIAFVDYRSKIGFGFNANKNIIVSCSQWHVKMYNDIISKMDNKWVHIALVKMEEDNDVLLYIDGELQTVRGSTNYWSHTTDTLLIGRRSGGGNMTFYMNDFRAYDHCLSVAEIKEISQGLVLHYKLDYLMQQNLLTGNVNDPSTWTKNESTCVTNDNALYVTITSDSGNRRIYRSVSNVWTPVNSTFTVSFEAKANTEGLVIDISRSNNTGTNMFSVPLTTTWKHYSGQIINTAATTSGTLSIRCVTYSASFWIKNIKLERGPIESYFDINNQVEKIIYDNSGYGYNGTIIGTPTTNINTPRYKACLSFDGSSSVINCGHAFHIPQATEMTVSGWVYTDSWFNGVGKYFWSSQQGGGLVMSETSEGIIRARFNVYRSADLSTNGYINATYSKDNLNFSAAGWHLLTQTYDPSSIKLYIDGELKNTYNITTYGMCFHSTANLYLAAEATATSWSDPAACSISDFRVYYTALSAEDIQQLYQLGAKIDNTHKIHTFELNENKQNKITKTGQVRGALFSEFGGMSYLKYDNNIYIEPDGSCWIRVFHHNNPAAGRFTSTNDFEHSIYIDEDRWFNMELAYYLDKWEIMVKGKFTSTANEWKLRWTQQYNPMIATYANVAAANVIKIMGGEGNYEVSPSSWGGLYKKNSNTYLCANNGTSSSWWGAIGAWNVHQSGLPGWGPSQTVTTTGYNDVYLRIDNVTFSDPTAKTTKNNIWTSSQFIEI